MSSAGNDAALALQKNLGRTDELLRVRKKRKKEKRRQGLVARSHMHTKLDANHTMLGDGGMEEGKRQG